MKQCLRSAPIIVLFCSLVGCTGSFGGTERSNTLFGTFQPPSAIRSLLRVDDDEQSSISYKRKKRIPTKVSGYGSKSSPFPSTVDVITTTTITTHNKQRTVSEAIQIQNTQQTNATLYIQPVTHSLVIAAPQNKDATTVVDLTNFQPNLAAALPNLTACIPVEGIYGIYKVPSGTIFVTMVASEPVLDCEIFRIRRVKELYLHHVPSKNATATAEEIRQLQLLRQSLKDHDWYYCDTDSLIPDLTRTVQRSLGNNSDTSMPPDSRFFWNKDLLEPIASLAPNNETANLLLSHVIPVTSAFCGIQHTNNYTELLITRRSRFRAGTRFTKRGADDKGHVANFAETEQILIHRSNGKLAVASFVQTRGSIPLLWSSPTDIKTYRPRIRIGTDPIEQARAMREHLLEHFSIYVGYNESAMSPSVLMVNLIDKHSDQGRLGRAFDAVLKAVLDIYQTDYDYGYLNRKSTEHLWFDFHAEVKSGRWDKLADLLSKVKSSLQHHGYFLAFCNETSAANLTFEVQQRQSGVVRTNCMDCLDRTNVVQSIFGRYILFQQLSNIAHLEKTHRKAFLNSPMTLPWKDCEVAHRLLWADNADAISRLYAGTPALKGDFTRTGKRTKKGALDDGVNSLQRFYLNNFLDADRQEGMDLMTGYHLFGDFEEIDRTDVLSTVSDLMEAEQTIEAMARKMLLDSTARDSDDRDFSIQEAHLEGTDYRAKRRHFDLRWLPGDLQTEVRDKLLASFEHDDHLTNGLLNAMDQRSSSVSPWWVVADSSDDESEGFDDLDEIRTSALNSPGYLLGALIAGTQAPFAVALLVTAVLGIAFLPSNEDIY